MATVIPKSTRRRIARPGASGLAALLGLCLILVAVGLDQVTRDVVLDLPQEQIEKGPGHAYKVPLKHALERPWRLIGDNANSPYRSNLQVREDGEPLGPPHVLYESLVAEGGGAFVHWGRSLFFSTSDNSDPRHNGRRYALEGQAQISPNLIQELMRIGAGLTLVGLAGVAWRNRASLRNAGARATHRLIRRRRDYLLAAIVPLTVSSIALALIPTTWNGSDSTIWLLWQWEWVPHHPPLYPAFMALADRWLDEPLAVVRFALTIQHLATTLAIAYLASRFTRVWQILLASLLASLAVALHLYAHGLFTEGLALPFLLVFLGALLRLQRDGFTPSIAAAAFIGLLGASLTRHLYLVLTVLPVVFVLLHALLNRTWSRSALQRSLTYSVALAAAVAASSQLATQSACAMLDAQCTSIIGRAGVYRVQATYERIPPEQRPAWLAQWKQAADSPELARAFELMATTPNPWTGPRDAMLAEPTLVNQSPDELMNAGFKMLISSPDPDALAQWASELRRAILGTSDGTYCRGQLTCLLESSAYSIEQVYPQDPRIRQIIAGTSAAQMVTAEHHRAMAGWPWVTVLDHLVPLTPLNRALLLLGSLGLGLTAVLLRRDPGLTAMILTLWTGVLLYATALTFITVVLPRYLSPLDVLIWLGNTLALIGLFEWLSRARHGGSTTPVATG